jgi:hypothetical protein
MNYINTLLNLIISLILSPIVIYVVLLVAKFSGASYEMSHGETFIVWILMAILINNCNKKN